jgi:hypothetical protein
MELKRIIPQTCRPNLRHFKSGLSGSTLLHFLTLLLLLLPRLHADFCSLPLFRGFLY